MANYLIKDTTLSNIANSIRNKTGSTEKIKVADMANEISGISAGGVDTSDATATASDILGGKTAYVDGEKITGTIATKTSSDLTASGATVIVPTGYYASQATKTISSGSAKTPATTVTKNPTISVNSSGLITASVSGTQNVTPTVSAGYVSSGTAGTITVSGSATKQLTTQAAKTITPSTSSQTAVASGRYTTGAVTVAAIPSNYEDVGAETSAYTTKLASLETAVTALETELAGKAGGGGGGSITQGTFTFTNNGMIGPGTNECVLTTDNLNASTRNCFLIFCGDYPCMVVYRKNVNEAFDVDIASSGAIFLVSHFTIDENEITAWIDSSYVNRSFSFIAY